MRALPAIVLSLFILCVALADSRFKKVWHDEIYTELIAKSGSVVGIWQALASGTDLNPPVNYLAVRFAYAVFGPSPVTLRLPSALGVTLMCLAIYAFVARRYPAPYAWLAMLFPIATEAFFLASEGRPYGLLMGFSALALLCWQRAVDSPKRRIWLTGLALSLAAAVSTHYYGTLAVVPLAIGEFVRTLRNRRIDLPIWLALFLGPLALLASVPLMIEARKYASTFWARPSLKSIPKVYAYLLEKSTPAYVGMLFVAVLAARRFGRGNDGLPEVVGTVTWTSYQSLRVDATETGNDFAPHELAAVASFAAMPVLAVALATVGKIGFTERYAVISVIGLAIFVAIVARRLFPHNFAPALLMSAVIIVWTIGIHAEPIVSILRGKPVPEPPVGRGLLEADTSAVPIVVPHPFLFLEASTQLPAPLASRLVFISEGDDTATLALRVLSRLHPLKVEEPAAFLAAHTQFRILIDNDGDFGRSFVAALIRKGLTIQLVSRDSRGVRLYQVKMRE